MDNQPWLIVGLGNPGTEYAATRHNVGYLVLDILAQRIGANMSRHRRAHAHAAEGRLAGQRVVLLRSRGYMNESGGPVKAAADYGHVPPTQIIVIHDELDIPFGSLRLKFGGGDGGHNGLKSIRRALGGGDFYRVRVGIGRPPDRQDASDYVLRPFAAAQRKQLPLIFETAADASEVVIMDGLQVAQNRYHTE